MLLVSALALYFGAAAFTHASAVPGHRHVRRQDGPVSPDTIKDCTYFYDSQPGDTCASIASDWGITVQQFQTYNPSIKSDCSGLVTGNAYCVEENYGMGPVAPTSSSSTASTTSNPPTTTQTSTGPSPVQSGISPECQIYYKVESGDTCAGIVDKYHTFTIGNLLRDPFRWLLRKIFQFRNAIYDIECLQVCVGIPGTPTAPPTTTTVGATPGPSPTQSGLVSTCKSFYKVQEGDYCEKIVSSYGTFSLADLLVDPPFVCVGVPGTPTTRSSISTTTTAASPTGPSPTQSGIISSCTKFYKTVSGDTCQVISDKYGTFTVAEFISWNPAVGSQCSTLFLDYYYCIAVPGTPTTRSTTSTTKATSTTSSGPSPTQSGIISSCTKYYKTVSGDTCQVISDRIGTFSVAQFISWNPAVGNTCSQLFLDYYYCIAIPGTPTTRTSTSTTISAPPTPTPNGPQPQQPGIVANCNKFYLVKSGDSCYTIQQAQSITAAEFFGWNTGIKSDCSNLFGDYYGQWLSQAYFTTS
ncbi:MAG: hypothetical protein Q9171_001708 [Xanthocarpia ochracea]